MTLIVKDGNSQPQNIGTQPDAAGALAIEHVMCTVIGGVATPVTVLPVEIVGGTDVAADGSGTIATGGTAQLLFAGSVPVNGFLVQNNHASETMWINDAGQAGSNAGFQIPSGGVIFVTPSGYKPMGAVSIFAASTAHPFTARRW